MIMCLTLTLSFGDENQFALDVHNFIAVSSFRGLIPGYCYYIRTQFHHIR